MLEGAPAADLRSTVGSPGVGESKTLFRIPLRDAERLAAEVMKKIKGAVKRYDIAGSIRRKKSDIGDVDVVVVPKSVGALKSELTKLSQNVWGGQKLLNMVYKDRQFNFVITDDNAYGAALMHTTGSAQYNIGLRSKAKKLGYKLNQYGLIDVNTGDIIASKTEDDIYKALGRDKPRPPEQRG